ncbi:hypothetical protein [Modestobacter marinus]|uniref:hypothetical protein n=1 Tax=Modestobacter marinus TaxID=477641 RepID=UPI001C94FC7A|nr:hypothetical protein [Modestobacter marinus]
MEPVGDAGKRRAALAQFADALGHVLGERPGTTEFDALRLAAAEGEVVDKDGKTVATASGSLLVFPLETT